MANNASALKRIRQTKTRTAANKALKSRMRTARRRVLEAVEAKKGEDAQKALGTFNSIADKAASKGVVHRQAAARYKSRMYQAVAAMA